MSPAGSREAASMERQLATSPRGLVVLADLCGIDLSTWSRDAPPAPPRVHPRLGAELRYRQVTRAGGVEIAERGPLIRLGSAELAVEVLASVQGLAWWGERRSLGRLVGGDGVLTPPARDLLASPGARWWADAIDRESQVLLGPSDEPPDVDALACEQNSLAVSAWRVPQALTSSRTLGERLPSVRLCAGEAVHRWATGSDSVGVWAVRVYPAARVYEIHSSDDWADLCSLYPARGPTPTDYARWGVVAPTSVAPAWERVRRDWDGVHVSMAGLLTGAGRPMDVDGAGAVLEDVDSEFTAWFRPLLVEPELIATVDRSRLP